MTRIKRTLIILACFAIGGFTLYYGMRWFLAGSPLSGSDAATSPDGKYDARAAYFIENHVFTKPERYYLLTVSRRNDGTLLRCIRIPHTPPESFRYPRSSGPFTPVWAPDSNSVSFRAYFHRSDQIDDQIILGDIKAKDA